MKNNKGITLVALVIMIMILIVLAGIAFNIVVEDKVFDAANQVVEGTENITNEAEQLSNDVRNMIM